MNLITEIDNYLLQEYEQKQRESYYPSEVSKCLRQLYYRWINEKQSNPIEAGAIWKMRMGDKAHDMIHEFLEKAGFDIMNEVSFKKDVGLKYPISGRIDNVFIDEDGTLSGIEIKSSYGAGIKQLQKNKQAKQDDINQVIIYSGCTDIKRWYLIYFGRDNAYRTQFIIEPKFDDFLNLLERFKSLEQSLDAMEIPVRQYLVAIKNGEIKDKFQKNNIEYKTDWQCSYCSYRNLCWKEVIDNLKENDNSEMFKL